MNQVVEALRAAVGALAAVFLVWHLFGISKWLAGKGGGRHGRRRRIRTPDKPFSNVPIDPR